jgi:hypothetical protein
MNRTRDPRRLLVMEGWNLPRLIVVGLILALGWANPASAQTGGRWFDGSFGSIPGITCVTFTPEITISAYTGFWGSTSPLFPQVGDVTYVHAVAGVVGLPCAGGDAPAIEFFLPSGVSLAISPQTPVICFRQNLQTNAVTNINCSQTPSAGFNGGLFFGGTTVASGQLFEVRVPVRFNREFLGIAGPTADKLNVIVTGSGGSTGASAWLNAAYRAVVNYPAPSASYQGGTNYRLTSFVYNNGKAGTASIDIGTASGNYNVGTGIAPVNITAAMNGATVTTDLTLNPSFTGTLYWRARFVTTSGTFFGPEQSFTANSTTPSTFTLSVVKSGAGTGTVSSNPQGIDCGATCTLSVTQGNAVTLTAAPDPGSQFNGFSGPCAGVVGGNTCTVTMDAAKSVTANFSVAPVPTIGSFDITTSGLPSGSTASIPVTGPGGFSRTFSILTGTGQNVSDTAPGQYTASPANVSAGGSTYVPKPTTQSFFVQAGVNASVTVAYAVGQQLSLTKTGTGTGAITSNPSGLNCGTTCTAFFGNGDTVTLTAAPAAGSSFASWGGACSGSTTTCTVTMNAAKSVTATFNTVPTSGTNFALTVTKSGTGTGGITSNPGGINCGATCSANFAQGSTVSLTATPDAASSFTGWSGTCSGTGACSVTMDAAKSVTVTFTSSGVTPPPPPPPAGATATASKASNTPATSTANRGSSNNAALGVNLGVGSSAGTLQSVTLSASGTGNDQLDITGVKLYLDANSNGVVDAGETALAQGTFSANDGTATLTLTTPKALAATSNSRLLVTLDFNSTIAGMPLRAALGSAALALLLGWRSRKPLLALALAGLAVTLTACPPTPPTPTTRTYQVTMTAVNLKDSSNATIPVTGLPISGTTITVTK